MYKLIRYWHKDFQKRAFKLNENTVEKEKVKFRYQAIAYKILSLRKVRHLVSHIIKDGSRGWSREEQWDLGKLARSEARSGDVACVLQRHVDRLVTHPAVLAMHTGDWCLFCPSVHLLSSNKDANARYLLV